MFKESFESPESLRKGDRVKVMQCVADRHDAEGAKRGCVCRVLGETHTIKSRHKLDTKAWYVDGEHFVYPEEVVLLDQPRDDGRSPSVLQPWMYRLPYQQQSVMLLACRGPDGMDKETWVKPLLRCYRATVLVAAKYGRPLTVEPADRHAFPGDSFMNYEIIVHDPDMVYRQEKVFERHFYMLDPRWAQMVKSFCGNIDPHNCHVVTHFAHACEIVGYKHPDEFLREHFRYLYYKIVDALHFNPELKHRWTHDFAIGIRSTGTNMSAEIFNNNELGHISGALSVAIGQCETEQGKAQYRVIQDMVHALMSSPEKPGALIEKLEGQLAQRNEDYQKLRDKFSQMEARYSIALELLGEQSITLKALMTDSRPEYMHTNSGGMYRVVLRGKLQNATDHIFREGDRIVGYVHPDEDEGYFRFEPEFEYRFQATE